MVMLSCFDTLKSNIQSPLGLIKVHWVSTGSPCGLSSGWSLIRVDSHIRAVSHQDGLSSGWSLISVAPHQGELSYQGGLSSGRSLIWIIIRVVSRQGGIQQGGLLSRVVSHLGYYLGGLPSGLSSGWSLVRVAFIWVVSCQG